MANSDNGSSGKIVAAMLVVAIVGIIAVTAVTGLISATDDPRTSSHDYVVDGTYDGEAVSGTGSSKYYNEGSNVYVYKFTFNCGSRILEETLILDSSGVPALGTYSDLGIEEMEGKQTHKYFVDDDCSIIIWVAENNTVAHMDIIDGLWSVTAFITGPVYSIVMQESAVMEAGQSTLVSYSVYPSHSDSKLVWHSSDESVAYVEDGYLKAVSKGSCKVTLSADDGKVSASMIVVVTD